MSTINNKARLTMGPVLFNWSPERKRDFWFRVADEAPVDVVYVGEVVCSKRTPFLAPVLPEVIERLTSAGKEVVLSTLALIMTTRESNEIREIAETADIPVEANDFATAHMMAGRPHVIGPCVNVYNEGSLGLLADRGATRICLPVELPGDAIRFLAAMDACDIEIQAWGRLPLAISARCYHARSHGLHKDGCQYVCDLDPDGLDVTTMDNQPFLTVNGTQTMSSTCLDLLGDVNDLAASGVGYFRLSPHSTDMVRVADVFRGVLDGAMEVAEGEAQLAALDPAFVLSNGFVHNDEGWRHLQTKELS